jgi:hypothetical protein
MVKVMPAVITSENKVTRKILPVPKHNSIKSIRLFNVVFKFFGFFGKLSVS